jgi:hypothetical protein
MKNIYDLKDKAILLGWIFGLLMIISVIWIISQQAQAFNLLRTVNNVFINNDDLRRVSKYVPIKQGKASPLGYLYSMYNSSGYFFVFTVFQDGILVPLGAVISDNGSVEEIIPLSAHAVQIFDKIPISILQIHIRRIESTVKTIIEG